MNLGESRDRRGSRRGLSPLPALLALLVGCGSAAIVNRDAAGTGGRDAGSGTDTSPTGGASGTSGGGGASGTGGGGASGTGGIAGTGGGVGGSGGGVGLRASGSVVCGSVTACPLASGGQCCYSDMDQSSTCQAAGATCDPVELGTSGTYYIKTTIVCDSTNDCPSSQICCYTQVYIGSSTACMAAADCVDVPATGGGYATTRRQVCDPAKVAPSECLSGTCETAPTLSQDLPPYLYLCQ